MCSSCNLGIFGMCFVKRIPVVLYKSLCFLMSIHISMSVSRFTDSNRGRLQTIAWAAMGVRSLRGAELLDLHETAKIL